MRTLLRMFTSISSHLLLILSATREFLDDIKSHGDEEDGDHRCSGRASHNSGPHNLSRDCACTPGEGKGKHTQEERKGRHENRPETQPGSLKGGIIETSSLFMSPLRKLDNQDGILSQQDR